MSQTADKLSAVADELICSADLQGYFTDVNPAFTRALGWSEAELLNSPYLKFVHEEDRASTERAFEVLERTGKLTDFRNRYVANDDSVVWVDWRAYMHEGEIYAIGRPSKGRRSTEGNLESVVSRVIGHASVDQERRIREREEARASERSRTEARIREADHNASAAKSRATTFKTWVAAILAVAGSVGAFGAWAVNEVRQSALRTHELEERKVHVDSELDESKNRDVLQDKKLRRLGSAQVRLDVQVSDSTGYTAKQLAAMSSKAAAVKEPESVKLARDRVTLIKEDLKVDELFAVPDPDAASDPFAGVEKDTAD